MASEYHRPRPGASLSQPGNKQPKSSTGDVREFTAVFSAP